MGGGKLPPRQKMIGMMYLVLTALLAMNVSKDILNAFIIVNDGLETTNKHFMAKNETSYALFDKAKMENPTKVTPFYNKAMQAKAMCDELYVYIEALKKHLIMETDKIPTKEQADTTTLKYVNAKDNYDIPTHILIGEPSNPNKGPNSATELKEKLNKTREALLALIDEKQRKMMNIGLETNDFGMVNGAMETWETGNFDHTPLAATITILSKIQADVRNAESDIVKELYRAVDAGDFKFDKLEARVIPKSSYVFVGEDYTADVFVAAYSTTQNPQILIGDVDTNTMKMRGSSDSIPVAGGLGKYSVKASAEGLKKWSGLINVKSPDGTIKSYPFFSEYMVAKPTLVVSADKMNVLYIGVDNPVSISVPGVPAENLSPSIEGGSLTPTSTKGSFIARVTKAGKSKVNVSAKFDKETKSMGAVEFRVKTLPTPQSQFAQKSGDVNLKKSEILAQAAVFAKMENFDFDIKAEVVSFDLTLNLNGDLKTFSAKGNRISPDMQNALKGLKNGSKFYIENIKAKLPDGTTRSLPSINIKVMI